VLVVHDLVAHVDGGPVFLQRALDDLDRAHDAGAKSPRLSQDDFHRFTSIGGSLFLGTELFGSNLVSIGFVGGNFVGLGPTS
jgi:hypothetical protein